MPAGNCNFCVQYTETLDTEMTLDWDYTYFPFDQHTLSFHLSLAGFSGRQMFGCQQIADRLRQDAGESLQNLLPADGSWVMGTIPAGEELVRFIEGTGFCELRIPVRR